MTAPAKLPFEVVRARRAGARLAAVQALYSMEQTGRSARAVIAEFRADRLGLGPDGAPVEEADPDLFGSVVNNVVDRQADVDAAIAGRLSAGWKLTRVDALSRALLRAATGEFL
ncbi:MAG: transcription antitermination factor NusB, partial [Pseudomonadota bacterium]